MEVYVNFFLERTFLWLISQHFSFLSTYIFSIALFFCCCPREALLVLHCICHKCLNAVKCLCVIFYFCQMIFYCTSGKTHLHKLCLITCDIGRLLRNTLILLMFFISHFLRLFIMTRRGKKWILARN